MIRLVCIGRLSYTRYWTGGSKKVLLYSPGMLKWVLPKQKFINSISMSCLWQDGDYCWRAALKTPPVGGGDGSAVTSSPFHPSAERTRTNNNRIIPTEVSSSTNCSGVLIATATTVTVMNDTLGVAFRAISSSCVMIKQWQPIKEHGSSARMLTLLSLRSTRVWRQNHARWVINTFMRSKISFPF